MKLLFALALGKAADRWPLFAWLVASRIAYLHALSSNGTIIQEIRLTRTDAIVFINCHGKADALRFYVAARYAPDLKMELAERPDGSLNIFLKPEPAEEDATRRGGNWYCLELWLDPRTP